MNKSKDLIIKYHDSRGNIIEDKHKYRDGIPVVDRTIIVYRPIKIIETQVNFKDFALEQGFVVKKD